MKASVVVALVLVLSGCSAGEDPVITPPAAQPSADAQTCNATFPANTEEDTETGSGAILGLRAVRAAAQPGSDRVVFELQGRGAAGWRVGYVDAPVSDGSGAQVAVKGSHVLQVLITHVGTPSDTGVPGPTVKRLSPSGLQDVQEVVLDKVFEGQWAAFVGLDAERPFKVTRLSSPPRVIVDVRHC